jgi:hypothetical protein
VGFTNVKRKQVTDCCYTYPQKAQRYEQKYNKKMQKAILLPGFNADLDQ